MMHRLNAFLRNLFQLQNQPIQDSLIKDKLDKLLYTEEVLGESRVNRINLGIVAAYFIVCLLIGLTNKFDVTNQYNFIGISMFLIYNVILYFILKKGIYRPYLKYLTAALTISIVTFIITGYSVVANNWILSLKTTTVLAYILAIVMNGYYKRPKIVLFSSFLAMLEYSGLVLFTLCTGRVYLAPAETFNEPAYSIDAFVSYLIVFLLSGVLISFFCQHFNILLTRTLITEAEKNKAEKAKEEIAITSQIKTNLFVNISHELKTPLTLIWNYLDKYIKNNKPDGDLVIIRQNVDKLLRDMVNFLNIEKLENGQVFYDHDQTVDLSQIILSKVPFFKVLAERKQIAFDCTDIEGPIYIKADPTAVDQIVNNLVDNAIKFTPRAGKIRMALRANSEEASLVVQDTGIGISDEYKQYLFHPYYQISHSKRNIQGIGMGLSIIKRIMDSLHGRIILESELNIGSTFTIVFREHALTDGEIVTDAYESIQPFDSIPANLDINDPEIVEGRHTILIVEDNIDMLQYLRSSLEKDYNVGLATDGKDAFVKLSAIPVPNLIISDIMMDTMDGYEFCREFRKTPKFAGIPFIFLTAKSTHSDKIEGLENGAIDYIYKPFKLDELTAKIKSLLLMQDEQKEKVITQVEQQLSKLIRSAPPGSESRDNQLAAFCTKYKLTHREQEIVAQVRLGLSNEQIGEKVFLSSETVKKHLQNIFKKCNVKSRTSLVSLLSN